MEKGRSASARATRTGLTLEARSQLAETIIEAVRQPLVVIDADHRIQIANRGPSMTRSRRASSASAASTAGKAEAERRIAEFTERTQARFSQELHDRVAEGRAGLRMMAGRLREELDPRQRERPDHLVEGLEAAMDQVCSLSRALLPVDVEAEDLAAALDTLVRRFEALGPMTCRFESGPHARFRDSAVATHLYRLAQEALQNALEHSGAEHVTMRLHDVDRILLEIEDDRHGFEDRGSLGG